ncbi:hypothetical protein GCM10007862_11810 [Dyella lipolytica]|uniref:Alpha/beta fold hydrolase n=1 Tax=Dyella lipolytica TaxID=1867835 RepID=A0ABW8IUG6_9GAMM|nr:alpha/beta fold hydrolase [Dyella lipolytica]GLQ46130.1 hypothetical protein GCM10007862_11810 [Dyella lipolytica]
MSDPRLIDEIVPFADNGLYGLLTRRSKDPVSGPVLVLLNPGVIPRSGPFRLHVRLARRLAKAGIATFRFDLPGIGDATPDTTVTRMQAVTMALDAVQRHTGVNTFVMGGLCLGADLAWKAALQDPRIVGMLQIDGFARIDYWYYQAWAKDHFRWPPVRALAAIARLAIRRLRPVEEFGREWPARGEERVQLRAMLDRGVKVFALYTGGIAAYFRDPRQFASTYANAADDPQMRFEFWPDCDHVFFAESDRVRLIDAVSTWYESAFHCSRPVERLRVSA